MPSDFAAVTARLRSVLSTLHKVLIWRRIAGMVRLPGWLREEGALKALWNSPRVGVPLWSACGVLTLCWFFWVPHPGYAIGALALVAGIMSVREIKTMGKICWISLLIALLLTEFHAIDKDRAENQEQQKKFFDAQKQGFGQIASQASTNFAATTSSLKAAIEGLSLNIKIANQTLQQTQPYADLQYKNLSLGGKEGPNPAIPLPAFVPGRSYHLYVLFNNAGAETGVLRAFLGKTYMAKPFDLAAESALTKKFETDWVGRTIRPPATFSPGSNGLTEMVTDPLSDADIADIMAGRKALYYLLRFKFSDKQGVWFSDYCFGIQNPGQYFGLSWPCAVHNRTRYQPKEQ
jgi:hypothetical protein